LGIVRDPDDGGLMAELVRDMTLSGDLPKNEKSHSDSAPQRKSQLTNSSRTLPQRNPSQTKERFELTEDKLIS
jgi:hypothetical protein